LSLLAIRRARRLQHVFAELARELGEAAATRLPTVGLTDSPEEAAARAREAVGVSLDDQTGWRDPDVALKIWRSRLEGLGVLVFQFAMPPEEVSGFSLSNGVPAIVLNRRDHHSRRVFSLFHEWAHLLRGEAGLCEVVEGYGKETEAEVFCNAFAGAFLVPMRAWEESAPFVGYREHQVSLEDAANEGARLFSVSRYVILRRLLTGQAISRNAYRRTVEAWEREPRRPKKKAKGGAPPYLMTVSELGPRFVSRVLAAHERGLIGDGDLSDYLTLRLKHLDRVHELVPVA
jgi:Zn-dependent peptidase ImmA (M78 family)